MPTSAPCLFRVELLKSTESDHQENKITSHNEVENKMYINNVMQKGGYRDPLVLESALV